MDSTASDTFLVLVSPRSPPLRCHHSKVNKARRATHNFTTFTLCRNDKHIEGVPLTVTTSQRLSLVFFLRVNSSAWTRSEGYLRPLSSLDVDTVSQTSLMMASSADVSTDV